MVYRINLDTPDPVGDCFRFKKLIKNYHANDIRHRDNGQFFEDIYEFPSQGTVISRFYFDKTGISMFPDKDATISFSGFDESSENFEKLVQEIEIALKKQSPSKPLVVSKSKTLLERGSL